VFHVLTLTYLQPLDVIDQTRPAHIAWLNEEVAAGRILLSGRQESATGGVLVTSEMTIDEAQSIIDRDPYQLAGVVGYERLSFNRGVCAPQL